MSLWKIAWRSMQQRALASWLTAVSMGLGVALVVAVLVVQTVIDRSFQRRGEGYELIVGPKGSGLQLVLNSVYYLSDPVGTIPGNYYREFTEGQFALDVEAAIPICMGDSFRGFRVVGTTPEMFEKLTYYGGQPYQFAVGRNFDDAKPFEAVVGAAAARETRLKPGDRFKTGHGTGEATKEHAVEFTVVGVLAQTGTPQDRAVFVNRRGFYQTHSHGDETDGHAAEGHAAENADESTHPGEEAGEHATNTRMNTQPRPTRRPGLGHPGLRRPHEARDGPDPATADQRRAGRPGGHAGQSDRRAVRRDRRRHPVDSVDHGRADRGGGRHWGSW